MKKAIVIGATSGIGKQLALLLAKEGYEVGITGRRTELLEELKSAYPEQFIFFAFDVTNNSVAVKALDDLYKKLGALDLLILSSGNGFVNEELDFGIEYQAISLNVSGFSAMADWAFKLFQQQGYGHFAAITSIAGLKGNRQSPAYGASKAYQINYMQALAQKANHLKMPIYITDLRPGFVDTAMAKGDGVFWVAPAEKAASQILNALNKKRKVAYITKRWQLIAILLNLLPSFVYNKL